MNELDGTPVNNAANIPPPKLLSKPIALLQLIVFSAIGLIAFFVPFTINDKSTILFDHGATYLVNQQHTLAVFLLFLLIIYGVAKPFYDGSWRKNITNIILTVFKVLGLILAVLYITDTPPAIIFVQDMLPFLF